MRSVFPAPFLALLQRLLLTSAGASVAVRCVLFISVYQRVYGMYELSKVYRDLTPLIVTLHGLVACI